MAGRERRLGEALRQAVNMQQGKVVVASWWGTRTRSSGGQIMRHSCLQPPSMPPGLFGRYYEYHCHFFFIIHHLPKCTTLCFISKG